MSKKGKKQDVNDDSFQSYVKFLYRPERLQVIQNKRSLKNGGTISPFLFAINHRKCCSKRHLKNIILLNIDLCACVCACVHVCVLMNNKTTKE